MKKFLKSVAGAICGVIQGIPIVTLYSNLSILVGKISSVFLQILEYLLTDQGFESPSQS